MPKWRSFALLAGLSLVPALPQSSSSSPFAGRWDLTIKTPKDTYPTWLEVTDGPGGPTARVVGRVSSVHPVENLKQDGNHLTFTSKEWFGKSIPVSWDFTVSGKSLQGTQKRSDGVEGKISGVPQAALTRSEPKAWSDPIPLFNGRDLTGWVPDEPANNHWKVIAGELVNTAPGANIRSTRPLQDFKLHIEYNCPDKGNSGVYLRGRYEVQVAYEGPGVNDELHDMGAIYGFLAPSAKVDQRPGQWESLDVTLVGRTVTVTRDGVLTIDHKEIPGITGGALDSQEDRPGPLFIQGDHTGGMKYRNITVSVPK